MSCKLLIALLFSLALVVACGGEPPTVRTTIVTGTYGEADRGSDCSCSRCVNCYEAECYTTLPWCEVNNADICYECEACTDAQAKQCVIQDFDLLTVAQPLQAHDTCDNTTTPSTD